MIRYRIEVDGIISTYPLLDPCFAPVNGQRFFPAQRRGSRVVVAMLEGGEAL